MPVSGDAAAAALADAEVIVVPSTTRVSGAALERLEGCRLLITTTSGTDHIDLRALAGARIAVCRLPLARRDAVVETTLAMILALTRSLGPFQEAARGGRWERPNLARYGATLLGTVGVVGVGVIGARVAEIVEALGARCLRNDPALAASTPLGELLASSDVVTLHCDLTDETRQLFGRENLARMRPGAVLVNTARGGIVVLEDAIAAIDSRHLGGLGLDVYPEEPANLGQWVRANVILTPHAAGWHPRLGEAIAGGVAAVVRALMAGEPLPWRVG